MHIIKHSAVRKLVCNHYIDLYWEWQNRMVWKIGKDIGSCEQQNICGEVYNNSGNTFCKQNCASTVPYVCHPSSLPNKPHRNMTKNLVPTCASILFLSCLQFFGWTDSWSSESVQCGDWSVKPGSSSHWTSLEVLQTGDLPPRTRPSTVFQFQM